MKVWILVLISVVMVLVSGKAFAVGQEGLFSKGEALYNKNCSRCHGLKGAGTDKGPPLVHDIYKPSHHGDMAFHLAVMNGVRAHHWRFGDMPKIEGVGMAEAGMITKYIRSIQREAGIF
jgi:mono/diheme cytochrome c family protein